MEINSLDYIVTAKHYSFREGADGTVKGRILRLRERVKSEKNVSLPINHIDTPVGAPVFARIEQGQWIADCDVCSGAEFVDPEEPIFFCFGCGNRYNDHAPRPVIFPEQREEIEQLILQRPVDDARGLTDLERAGMARPLIQVQKEIPINNGSDEPVMMPVLLPLSRSWNPGESLDDLHEQQDHPILEWIKEQEK